jgi:hypothetical protein
VADVVQITIFDTPRRGIGHGMFAAEFSMEQAFAIVIVF